MVDHFLFLTVKKKKKGQFSKCFLVMQTCASKDMYIDNEIGSKLFFKTLQEPVYQQSYARNGKQIDET